ncbi:MAG: Succinyl-CoA:(R)-benzylsuccinate CoA-transferase subunit BbsF [Pseudomonadota bacterium]|jgi:crotonobetainyl-CoA:carnitine CoA-transferase CaiB-like acyl-CoA transferase
MTLASTSTSIGEASGPLNGLRVIEICSTIAGPACTRLMADFGAEVIKIEPPEGDPVRQMGQHVDDVSLYAASLLRNKKSVVLDLKNPQDLQIAKRLIESADILVENNRPGVMERLGLGYEDLSITNPGLVMVRISGFGQTGPYSSRPGYGAICEAVGGVRHMTGDPDRPPARVALATTDYLTSTYAAFGALAALREKAQTGLGQVVDVALYETAFTQMEPIVPAYEKHGTVPKREGPNLPRMAPNSLYPTQDGSYILIAANSNPTCERLLKAMGQEILMQEPAYATIRARGEPANARALDEVIAVWTSQYSCHDLEVKLEAVGVPNTRVYTIADIYKDPHFLERNMLVKVPHPKIGHTTQMGVVPRLSRTPGSIRHTGHELGADTEDVIRQFNASNN